MPRVARSAPRRRGRRVAVAVAVTHIPVVVGHVTAAAAALVEHGRRRRLSQAVLDALEGVLGAVRYARPGAHFLEFVPVVGQVQHRGLLFDRGLVAALRAPRGDEALDEHGLRAVRRPAQSLEGGAQVLDLPALQLLGVRLRVRGSRRRRRGRGRRWLGATRPPPRARRGAVGSAASARCAAFDQRSTSAGLWLGRAAQGLERGAQLLDLQALELLRVEPGVARARARAPARARARVRSASAAGAARLAGAAASSSSMAAPDACAATSRSTSAGLWPSSSGSGTRRGAQLSTFRRLSFSGRAPAWARARARSWRGRGAGSVSAGRRRGAGSAGAAASSSTWRRRPTPCAATSRSTSAGL